MLFEGAKAVFGHTGVISKGFDRGLGDGESVFAVQVTQGDPSQVGGSYLKSTLAQNRRSWCQPCHQQSTTGAEAAGFPLQGKPR